MAARRLAAVHSPSPDAAEHALRYAAAGLEVLPLKAGQKVPATAHGKDDATTDAEQIREWWTHNPAYNIGIRVPAWCLVLDVDPRHGGATNLVEFKAGCELPTTWTARTGGGGLHIWLRGAGPFRGQLCEGVDIKTNRGYVVAPPSVHPNGKPYSWSNREPIAYAPSWLLQAARPPGPAQRSAWAPTGITEGKGSGLVRVVANSLEGGRNAALYWAACRAADDNLLEQLRDNLEDAARATGLTDKEISQTLESARRISA